MSASLRLRPMRWRDIPSVVALERGSFPADAWDERSWWTELAARPRRDYTVLEGQGEVLGYAGLDQSGAVADVMTIAVAPRLRGTGQGARLLGHLLSRAAAGGARQVMLELRADNAAARALYERAGFAVVHTRRAYYQPGGVDALVMRAEVGGG